MPWPIVGLAGVLVLIALLWLPRRLWNARHSPVKCTRCGYSRAGLSQDRPCPECGKAAVSAADLRRVRLRAFTWSAALLAAWCMMPGKLGGTSFRRMFDPWQHVLRIRKCGWTIDAYENVLYRKEAGWLTDAEYMPQLDAYPERDVHPLMLRARSDAGAEWASQEEGWRIVLSDGAVERDRAAELGMRERHECTVETATGTGRDAILIVMEHSPAGILSRWSSYALFDCNDTTAPIQSGDEHSTWRVDPDTMTFDKVGVYGMAWESQGSVQFPLLSRPVIPHIRDDTFPDDLDEWAIDWEGTRTFYRNKLLSFAKVQGFDPLNDDAVVAALLQWSRRPRSLSDEYYGDTWGRDMQDLETVVAEEILRGRADRAVRLIREEERTRSPDSTWPVSPDWPPPNDAEYPYEKEIKALQTAPWPE